MRQPMQLLLSDGTTAAKHGAIRSTELQNIWISPSLAYRILGSVFTHLIVDHALPPVAYPVILTTLGKKRIRGCHLSYYVRISRSFEFFL
jgi:hypothetical protein